MRLKLDIPHASEARYLIEKGEYEKANKQIIEIQQKITQAIEMGLMFVTGADRLELCVQKSLKELGYRYESTGSEDGSLRTWYKISW